MALNQGYSHLLAAHQPGFLTAVFDKSSRTVDDGGIERHRFRVVFPDTA
jgi:hypothetical protein